jgi:hypothetical protein
MTVHHANWWRVLTLLCLLTYSILVVSASPSMFRSREDSSATTDLHGTLSLNTTMSNRTTPANDTISAARKIIEEAMIQQVGDLS